MADSDFLVTISGAALSLLYYENVRSLGDQMGFLLGETLEFVVKTYTDSDTQVETIKVHNDIQAVVTCPLSDLLHDSTGRIDKEKLKDFMRDRSKQVIGWFRFRRDTSLTPTMRDKILHKEFASHFSGSNGSKEEFFVTCLLSSSTSYTKGTHKYKHVFLRRKRGIFEPIPLRVNNLGIDSARHDGSDYKPTPTNKSSDIPDIFASVIEPLNLDLSRVGELESAIAIQKAAELYLSHLIPEVSQSDLEVAELEKQVQKLRNNISISKLGRDLKVNGTSQIQNKNCQIEKENTSEDERILGKFSSSKIESSDNIKDEIQTYQDHSTSTSQTVTFNKPNNGIENNTQSVNQDKSRRMCLNVDVQSNLTQDTQDTLVNTVPEIKVGIAESVPSTSRHSTGIVSEMMKKSICKKEMNESSAGAGRGNLMQEFKSGLRKSRRSVRSTPTRSCEKITVSEMSEQELPDTECVKSTPSQKLSYSEAAKKSLDSSRNVSGSTENH